MAKRSRSDGLGARGGAFWDDVMAQYSLDPFEAELAREIARIVDLLDDLKAQLKADGLTVTGSMGQKRLHPAVQAVSSSQLVLEKLLSRLKSRIAPEDPAWDQELVRMLSTPASYQ